MSSVRCASGKLRFPGTSFFVPHMALAVISTSHAVNVVAAPAQNP